MLRIEDTDQARSTPESEQAILDSLRWLGLSWDEGPDVGGPHGPYRQSERSAIYTKYVDRAARRRSRLPLLLHARTARRDARSAAAGETSAALRRPLPDVSPAPNRASARADRTLRRADERSRSRHAVIEDLRRGKIEIEWNTVDMQVLMKSDGLPTYHLANVVDDHLMEITHVIRGEEWVSSAPKHLLLYQYFGWELPAFLHVPLLRNPDKSKLSKRKNPTSILFFRGDGLSARSAAELSRPADGLVGRRRRSDDARRADRALRSRASLARRSGVRLREARLAQRQTLARTSTPDAFVERVLRVGRRSPERFATMAALAQARVERLSDLGPLLAFFFAGRLTLHRSAIARGQKLDRDDVRRAIALAMWDFDALAQHSIRRRSRRCSRASPSARNANCATSRGCSTSR